MLSADLIPGFFATAHNLQLLETNEVNMNRMSHRGWTLAAAVVVAGSTLFAGCAGKNDPIAQADKTDVAKGVPAPSLEQTKAIAEEGFIYGLPLVMNYAVMNEFAVDPKSSQFKAPFNQLHNEHRVATPAHTAVLTPNSDTPYSILWADLRPGPPQAIQTMLWSRPGNSDNVVASAPFRMRFNAMGVGPVV